MASKLDQLRSMTVVVGDTGDIDAVRSLRPQDCTTNPSIVLKAVQSAAFAAHLDRAVAAGRGKDNAVQVIADDLTVSVGAELAALVQERCFYHLEAPVERVTGFDTPYPHSLEWAYFPGPIRIGEAIDKLLGA